MSTQFTGHLAKMEVTLGDTVSYQLPLDDHRVPLNEAIGESIAIEHIGDIHCIHCGRPLSARYCESGASPA